MLTPQRHGWPLVESGVDVRFIILAANGKQFSQLLLPPHELLERQARRIKPDTGRAVLAANARPERLVAVQHDDFAGGPSQGVKLPGDYRRQGGVKRGRIRNMSKFVTGW